MSDKAKQYEKRFAFTTKIIKALFMDGSSHERERDRDRESQSRDSGNKSDSEDRSTRAKSMLLLSPRFY